MQRRQKDFLEITTSRVRVVAGGASARMVATVGSLALVAWLWWMGWLLLK